MNRYGDEVCDFFWERAYVILNANGSKMRARKRIEFNVPHEAGDGKLKVLVVFSHMGLEVCPPWHTRV